MGRDLLAAGLNPRRESVGGRPRADVERIVVTLFRGQAQRGGAKRIGRQRTVDAVGFAVGGFAVGLAILVEAGDAEGEALRNNLAVEIEGAADAVVRVEAEGGAVAVFVLGAFGHAVGDAGGIADAEEDGVGTAGEGEALDVVSVFVNAVFDEIAAGGADEIAADVVGDAEEGIVARGIAGEAAAEIRGGVGDEIDEVLHVRQREVLHEGRRHVGDGRADKLVGRREAGAGQRLTRLVALVFRGGDLERGEHYGLVCRRRSGSGGLCVDGAEGDPAGEGGEQGAGEFFHGLGGGCRVRGGGKKGAASLAARVAGGESAHAGAFFGWRGGCRFTFGAKNAATTPQAAQNRQAVQGWSWRASSIGRANLGATHFWSSRAIARWRDCGRWSSSSTRVDKIAHFVFFRFQAVAHKMATTRSNPRAIQSRRANRSARPRAREYSKSKPVGQPYLQ